MKCRIINDLFYLYHIFSLKGIQTWQCWTISVMSEDLILLFFGLIVVKLDQCNIWWPDSWWQKALLTVFFWEKYQFFSTYITYAKSELQCHLWVTTRCFWIITGTSYALVYTQNQWHKIWYHMEKLHQINSNYPLFQVAFAGLPCSWIKSFSFNWWSTSISFHKGTVDGRIQHCDPSLEDVFMWHVWACKILSSYKWIQSYGMKILKRILSFFTTWLF